MRRRVRRSVSHQATPTSGRGGSALLSTKLAVPQLPPGLVLRPRLMDRLSEGVVGRVTLVSAGPGWGKTMLVARWAATHSSSQPVAWLSLDSFDNDPVLFWSYLAAAVHDTGEAPDGHARRADDQAPGGRGCRATHHRCAG